MSQIRCHSIVYGEGQVCPPTTTFPAECYSKYGGGRPLCDIPKEPVPTTVVAHPVPRPPSDLPFTGGDVVGMSMLGIGMLAAGIALARSNRRNRRMAAEVDA